MLLFEHIQNRQTGSASHGIAAKGAEEFHTIVETCGDLRSGDNCGEREGISNWFAEHDDIRDDGLRLESPEVRAKAAEADLHFIGDADAACGADVFVSLSKISRRENNLAGDTRQRFRNIGRYIATLCARCLADF